MGGAGGPVRGGAGGAGVAGAGGAVTGGAGASSGPADLTSLLSSPRLSLPPAVRSLFASGGVDPRLASVLQSAVTHHTIVVGQMESVVEPVHAQAIDIVSVDGQPVGPGNVAARDLVTEIAALDPSLRPSEIGTPWPIESQGFFTDPAHQNRLHLAFSSPADYRPGGAGVAAPADGAGVGAAAGAAVGPLPATPAAQGVAQAAGSQLAADAAAPPGAQAQAQPMLDMAQTAPPSTSGSGQQGAGQQLAQQASDGGIAATGGSGGTGGHGGYVNPLPATARIGRTDQGVDADLNPGDPIVAIGTSRVLGIMPNWYAGQPYLALQLLDGPMKGHNWYVAEQLNPAVTVGQIVQAGQPVAHYASSGTGIEIGWAGPSWEQTLAQATGHDNADIGDHANTPAGLSFRSFLDSLGSHHAPGSGAGTAASADVAGGGGSGEGTGVSPDAGESAPAAGAPAGGGLPGAGAVAGAGASVAAAGSAGPSGAGGLTPNEVAGAGQLAEAGKASANTAPFKALEPHERSFHRNTVKFMAAVQPDPQSPLYRSGAGQAEAAAGQPAGQQPGQPPAAGDVVAPQPSAGGTGGGVQHPGQGGALTPDIAADPVSVSSSLLTSGQGKFAARLAQLTGLSPRVVAAWELAEESGSAARGREAQGNFNWLNIGYFDSGTGRIAFDKAFSDPISAAEQTARFLKGTWGGASSSIRAILNTVGQGPQQQMMAIANSDWASSHYGGGANLLGTYNELGDIKVMVG